MCKVDMLSLGVGLFELDFNSLIEVRISSINDEGQSLPSPVNTAGASVRTKPGKAKTPSEGAQTSHNQI